MAQPRSSAHVPDDGGSTRRTAVSRVTKAVEPAAVAAVAPAKRAKASGPRRTTNRPATAPSATDESGFEALKVQLLATVRAHYPQADLDPIERAFDLAVEAHAGQRRATGEPYVTHPVASAQITAELGIDPIAVTAALLHDVPEDTEYGLTDIEDRFGPEVARLVDGVTKLS